MTRLLPLALLLATLGCRNKDIVLDSDPVVGDDSAPQPDEDGDGWLADEDCDDQDPGVNPDSVEVCDGVDNNCDGVIDEGVTSTWYADQDGDGYGDSEAATEACEAPEGHVEADGDCDDGDAAYHPGAAEDDCADPNDYNCDGSVGFADNDGDGWAACEECDDTDAAISPDATEVCDGLDNDCDGLVDDADDSVDAGSFSTFWADADGDGYGDAASATQACEAPSGSVADSSDCDDTDAAVNPGATEVCDGLDNDCDALIDDADDSLDASSTSAWYADADGDGFGDAASASQACEAPSGAVADDQDCDDGDAAVNPDAVELCDGVDNDCDGVTDPDDSADAPTWYADADGDGYGDPNSGATACSQPSGATADTQDCDDGDAAVNPDALELCDGVDNDCDGRTDPSDAWWDASWGYRVPVTVAAATYDVDGPPVSVDVDFRAALDSLNVSGALSEDSIRVVVQDCSLGQPELPSQFEDGIWGLFDKVDHRDGTGDEAGAVLFLYDEDGDTSALETLAASSSVELAIYFDTTGSAPSYSGGLTASTAGLSNAETSASFDSSAGGLLDGLTWMGGSNLSSQVTSCCGNGAHEASWSSTPMYFGGTTSLAVDGPVMAAVESESTPGTYDIRYTYFLFDGRPELWAKVWAETTGTMSFRHASDSISGIRPWESRQDAIAGGASFTVDTNYLYADTSTGSEGLAWGYAQAPTYVVSLSAYDPYVIAIADDWIPSGGGTNQSATSGTAFFDNVLMLNLPHAGVFADAQDTLFGLMEGVVVTQGAAEAQ
ncbi:MAG: putative metal-binding motif-containing protein [Alphaproteobacteria bacterium]|nr:putative metal-binding motif-containing protein [Alphaproteobacteria bacterium]